MSGKETHAGDGHQARTRIANAAISLFARKGFTGTSMREIAEAAGVTKPTVYYYFGSKVGLGHAIVEEARALQDELIAEETGKGGSVMERLVGFIVAHYRGCEEHEALARFLYGLTFSPVESELRLDVEGFRKAAAETLSGILDDAVAGGVIRREVREEADLVLMGIVNMHLMASLHLGLALSQGLAERSVRLFLEGVRSKVGED